MLDGELAYGQGNYEAAWESLKIAIAREDSLEYAEPWAWMVLDSTRIYGVNH